MFPFPSSSFGAITLLSVAVVPFTVIRWTWLSPDVPAKKVRLSVLKTPATGAMAPLESVTLVTAPVAGTYSGSRPLVPV